MPDPFTLTSEVRGPAVVIRIGGRLDARSSPHLLQTCAGLRRPSHLVLNLSHVTFISSSGVGALLSLCEEFSGLRGSFRLAPISPEVRSSIRLLNLEPFLTLHESEAEALAQVEKAA